MKCRWDDIEGLVLALLIAGSITLFLVISVSVAGREVYNGDNIEIKDNIVVLPKRVKFVSVTPEGYVVVREATKGEWCESVYHIFNPSGKRVTRIEERNE